jgi:hypothetical protein
MLSKDLEDPLEEHRGSSQRTLRILSKDLEDPLKVPDDHLEHNYGSSEDCWMTQLQIFEDPSVKA